MDELDEKIIKYLKEDASMPISDIAKKLKIPKPTAYVRLNKLKSEGVIKKFTILLSKSDKVNAAIVDSKDYLISKLTSRTSSKIIEHLTSNPDVLFVIKISDTKMLVGWRGNLDIRNVPGIEKLTSVETIHWQD